MRSPPACLVALLAAAAVQCTLRTAHAAPAKDEVTELPGFGPPPTRHYSGFLDAKDGCAATESVCRIHYWFCEAEGGAAGAPVLLGACADKRPADGLQTCVLVEHAASAAQAHETR
jgi:hypothetical protein